ncbi:protein kinase [bacterium]|nr:protein kinase [bacterium]
MRESLEGLQTVILMDQHDRWEHGDCPLVEDYLREIPDLATDTERLLDVIYHEILLREQAGQTPELLEYLKRFPELSDSLQLQFQVHSGISGTKISDDEERAGCSPPVINGYRIIRELGRGSYGIVYEAWEQALKRSVALKILSDTENADDWSLREAQAIAQLTHPNIVPVHAVGETEDGVFFSQDLISDGTLAEFCRGMRQDIRDSAAMVETLAIAVEYAHQRQLIHCDLKPSNILLRVKSTRPKVASERRLSDFDPLISDYGLAIHLDTESRAFQGHLRGTLQYMAPEQTGQTGMSIGPATDIYALGVILYELLTGLPPFASESKLTTFLQIRHAQPVDPKSLRPDVPSDLNAICLACLNKEPAKRYPTAAALSEDLRFFLDGFAPTVVSTGMWGQLGRWCRRRPVSASLSAAMFLLLLGGIGLTVRQELQNQFTASLVRKQRAATYRNQILLVAKAYESADIGKAEELLDETDPNERSFEWFELKRRCVGTQSRISWQGHETNQLSVSPDGKVLAVGDAVDQITLVDLQTRKPSQVLDGHEVRLTPPVFHPRVTAVAAAGIDHEENWIWLWDTATGREIQKIGPLRGTPLDLVFVNHGDQIIIASCHDRDVSRPFVIETWDTQTGKRTAEILTSPSDQRFTPKARLSPDGKWLAWTPSTPLPEGSSHRHQVELIDAQAGTVTFTLSGHDERITALAFSPDSRLLATFDDRRGAFLWDPLTGQLVHRLTGLADAVLSSSFSRDGSTIVTAGRDQLITLWNCKSGERIEVLRGHSSLVWAVAFGPSSTELYSADNNRQIFCWQTDGRRPLEFTTSPAVTRMAFSRDGNTLLLSDLGAGFQSRDLNSGASTRFPERVLDFAISLKSDVIAAVNEKGELQVGSLTDPKGWSFVKTARTVAANGSAPLIATPDGKFVLALDASGNEILVIDASRKELVETIRSPGPRWLALACSSDCKTIAALGDDRTIQVWSFSERKLVRTIRAEFPLRAIAFRPSSDEVAAIHQQDRFVEFWNVRTGGWVRRITGHKLPITRLLFTSDGKRLITGSADRTVNVWDYDTGELLLTLSDFSDEIRGLALSPDDHHLAVASGMNPDQSVITVLGGSAAH